MSKTKKILPVEVILADSPDDAFVRGISIAKEYPTYEVFEVALIGESQRGVLLFLYEGSQPTDSDILTILNYGDTYADYRSSYTEQPHGQLKQ